MSCKDYDKLWEPLTNKSEPITDAVICAYSDGAGLGLGLFSMIVFSTIGLGLTIRTRHPGPVIIGGILSSAMMARVLPGIAGNILALVLFFGISGLGLWLYSRARSTL